MFKNTIIAIFLILLFLGYHPLSAQQSSLLGDTYVIKSVPHDTYLHINFPKKNFIIKKGGIADMKSVIGVKVKVLYSTTNKEGIKVATVQRTDGRAFFNAYRTITVELDEAVSSGELQKSS
ncbi:dihydroorotase [Ascidiimonas sp. W6]|uniref:dihydroorotase n=1 Tax=Ascidiimonas meishanensis TaxID=3128903 RepID=UPI0030ED42E0